MGVITRGAARKARQDLLAKDPVPSGETSPVNSTKTASPTATTAATTSKAKARTRGKVQDRAPKASKNPVAKAPRSKKHTNPPTKQKRAASQLIEDGEHITKKRRTITLVDDVDNSEREVQTPKERCNSLQASQQRVMKQNRLLESRCNEYEDTLVEQEDTIKERDSIIEEQQQMLESQRQTIKEQQKRLEKDRDALMAVEAARIDGKRWKKKYQRLKSESKKQHDRHDAMFFELHENLEKATAVHEVVSDTETKSVWKRMMRNFTFLPGKFDCPDSVPDHLSSFSGEDNPTVGIINAYRGREASVKIAVVIRHIFRRLIHEVFLDNAGVWGGSVGQNFAAMTRDMADEILSDQSKAESYSNAKYNAAVKLAPILKIDQNAIQGIVDSLKQDLGCFVAANQEHTFENDLLELVRGAVDLHILMMRSKGFFSFTDLTDIPEVGQSKDFSRDWMQFYLPILGEAGKVPFVEMQISPVLTILGCSSGDPEWFNRSRSFGRALVVVNNWSSASDPAFKDLLEDPDLLMLNY